MVHLSILIIWVTSCLLLSSLLKFVIVRQIHSKPLLHSTVIDLSYADCFVFLYTFEIVFAISDISCLAADTKALSFEVSFALSTAVYLVLRLKVDRPKVDRQNVDRQNIDTGEYDKTSTLFLRRPLIKVDPFINLEKKLFFTTPHPL